MGRQWIGMQPIFPADIADGRRGLGVLVDFAESEVGDVGFMNYDIEF
jgi:hypothetical protein